MIVGGIGLFTYDAAAETYNLGVAVDKIGFSSNALYAAGIPFIRTAVFSNGDVFTGGSSYTLENFAALATSTPFTSVTVLWGVTDTGNGSSFVLSDFRASPLSVPEPSLLALLAAGAAVAWRRRRQSA
jgi:hypothetical protein